MAQDKWTREQIIDMLHTNDKAVGRALLTLLEEQTFDEVNAEDTRHVNGRGFTQADARVMTSMAKQFKNRSFLSPKQIAFLRRKTSDRYPSRIGKYARQIAKKVNDRIEKLKFELQELESRSQSPEVERQAEARRQELARISPKPATAEAA